MKSYTDLEQSKKLAEILPLESADMFYRTDGSVKLMWEHLKDIPVTTPCWSLAPLMKIINSIDGLYPGIDAQVGEDNEWQICMFSYKTGCLDETAVINKDLLNACYEMIIKLHELKML